MASQGSDERTRADKVRARRNKPSGQTSDRFGNSAARRDSKPRPPVTRRTTPSVPPVTRKRRKVYMPLNAKGAEVGLPALPNLNLGWRFFSGVIFLFSLLGMIAMMSVNAFTITAIKLQGAQRLGSETVLSQLNLSGQSIVEIKPDDIETTLLETYPSLSAVDVSVGLPSSLTIRVTERQPVLAWQQNELTLWADAEGVMFPPRGELDLPLTVLANGDPPAGAAPEAAEETPADDPETPLRPMMTDTIWPRTTPEFISGITALSSYLPEGTSLLYDPQFGLGWEDPNGWLVYFGKDITDIDLKLAEYGVIIEKLAADGITPSLISLEFLHAPFYRLEQ